VALGFVCVLSRPRCPDAAGFAALTAATIATDKSSSAKLPNSSAAIHTSSAVSNAGLAATGALAGGLLLAGRFGHDPHALEAGWLSAEAAAGAELFTEAVKLATQRWRPFQGDHGGGFFRGGGSFPSGHAALSWSVAEVVALEYPQQPALRFGAYGLAAITSLARFPARQHLTAPLRFPLNKTLHLERGAVRLVT